MGLGIGERAPFLPGQRLRPVMVVGCQNRREPGSPAGPGKFRRRNPSGQVATPRYFLGLEAGCCRRCRAGHGICWGHARRWRRASPVGGGLLGGGESRRRRRDQPGHRPGRAGRYLAPFPGRPDRLSRLGLLGGAVHRRGRSLAVSLGASPPRPRCWRRSVSLPPGTASDC